MDEKHIEAERAKFEADAAPMGFSLARHECASPEPWSEYMDIGTGHRWAGWLAARATQESAPADAVNALCFKIAAIAEECADPNAKAALLGLLCEPPPTTADTWPIAKLTVAGDAVTAKLYAPGLPDGEHDVWPCPVLAPDGWQWVPVEPTAAMTAAACLNLPPMEISSAEEGQRHAADAWAAMLATAPQQQGGE